MISALVGALRAADPDITAEEIADVLWLAHLLPGPDRSVPGAHRPAAAATPDGPADAGDPAGDAGRTPPPDVHGAPPGPPVPPVPSPSGRERGRPLALELRLPPRRLLLDREPGVRIGSPAVPALPTTLGLSRALRLLQRQLPSRTAVSVDERATADLAADADLWLPVLRPVRDRWLDLALVVDEAASMAVWQRTVAELLRLLQRSGIFGDVRVWRMDSDRADPDGLRLRGESAVGAEGRSPRELLDPTGRRMILVVTDCVGRAWGDGSVGRALELWSAVGPVAVVQPLPQRLWESCVPRFAPVSLRATAPLLPNRRMDVRREPGTADGPDAAPFGTPIPVLELDARWLRSWASLVAGTGAWVGATVLSTGALRNPQDEPWPLPGGPERAPGLLRRFRAGASDEANRLAVFLAGAPLSLPVMRLVQNVMLPGSRPAHLAEVFLSGLLRRVSPVDRELAADEVEYDFLPGVRAELLRRLPKPYALQVLSRVSAFVSSRMGSPLDFKALLTDPATAAGVPELSLPFAQVAAEVLINLGGGYEAAGRRLKRMAEIAVALRGGGSGKQRFPSHNLSTDTPTAKGEGGVTGPSTRTEAAQRRPGEQPAVWARSIPLRNPHFTGRRNLLAELHETLVRSSDSGALLLHAVHGLGGVGKTQLAVEYAYQYASDYDLVWWIPAEDPALVRASLAELGRAMGLPESTDTAQTVAAVQEALRVGRPHPRWLLVFDNADQPEDLRPYLPHPSGHVLITSRNQSGADVAATVEVDVFDREESVALLRRRGRGISETDADRLANALGDLPLALEQAAAWQAETGMSVPEYLRLLETRQDQLLREKPPAGYSTPVAAAWGLAFDRLREQSPGAVQF
ncbi:MAG TPA: FxSxx-COOH system tetratricopeptide repeat protein, partial [Micromonospora sp.]